MEPRRVSWAAPLVDELDAKEQGRTLSHQQPGSFFSRQKAWMKDKGNGKTKGKQKGKSSRKGNQQSAKGKSKDKGKGQPRP